MSVWIIRGGREGEREELCLREGLIIIGWERLQVDLSTVPSRAELRKLMEGVYPDWQPGRFANYSGQVYRFVSDMRPGDYVVMPRKGKSTAAVGRAEGPYEYRPELGSTNVHCRPVQWLHDKVPRDALPAVVTDTMRGAAGTVTRVREPAADSWMQAFIDDRSEEGAPPAPVHLLLRWKVQENPSTVPLHKEVADAHGSVWWGKLGDPDKRKALSERNLERLQQQLDQGIETHVYLSVGDAWRTRLLSITIDKGDVDSALVPAYYGEGPHNLWLRLTEFERLEPEWVLQHLVLDSNPSASLESALTGRTSLFIVREVEQDSADSDRFFVLLQRYAATSGYHDEEGVRYSFDSNVAGHRRLAAAHSARFVYYRPRRGTPDGTASTFFGTGQITRVEEADREDGVRRYEAHIAEYLPFTRPVPISEFRPPGWNHQHSIAEITADAYEELLRRGSAEIDEFDLAAVKAVASSEPFNLDLSDSVYAQVTAALRAGKHVILTGPPGTAKTTLAQALAVAATNAALSNDYLLTTATADWTTYETIGGLRPTTTNQLAFEAGHFLAAITAGQWLVIDELNRSNFDRAFGQLFTVLSGQPVTLPYEDPRSGKRVSLVPPRATPPAGTEPVTVPSSWRLIATMNVFDKSLLFEMSYALMRRFAFIEVGSPPEPTYLALVAEAAENDEVAIRVVERLLPLRAVKDLGPAMFMDLARYVVQRRAVEPEVAEPQLVFESFYSYLLPQFEGIDEQDGRQLYGALKNIVPDASRLRTVLVEVLGLEKARLTGGPAVAPEEAIPTDEDDAVGE